MIEIFNNSDLRYLLIEYDDSISNFDLTSHFDIIMSEFEELKGTDDYQQYLEKIDDKLWKEYLIKAIRLTIMCIELGDKESTEKIIADFNLKVTIDKDKIIDRKAIGRLTQKIRQIETIIKLNAIQEEENKINDKKIIWEDLVVYIHTAIGVQIDYDCPVAQYLSYEKSANAVIKAKNKRNG